MNDAVMEITLLGWWGGFPKPGEACCGVLVRTAEGCLLLDCGCGVLSQLGRFARPREVAGVLLSHLHFDHMSDLGCLLYTVNHDLRVGLRDNKLQVWAPDTPRPLRDTIEYAFSDTHALRDGLAFSLAGLRISAHRVSHTVECYAFRLERAGRVLVYYTDTGALESGAEIIRDADLLLCEATMTEGSRHTIGDGHITDREAGLCAREGGARQLCLIHLPGDADPAVLRARASESYGAPVLTPDQQRVFRL